MKFFWIPFLILGVTLPQQRMNFPILFASSSASKLACNGLSSKHHRKHRTNPPVNPETNIFAPQFDPHSPELARQLMAVFGQDSLATRTQRAYKTLHPKRKFGVNKTAAKSKKTTKSQTHWIKTIMSDLAKQLPFNSDLNLGSNSSSDVYVEFNAKKDWQFNPDFSLNTEQTFRYGAQSRNYSETNFDFTQKQAHHAVASNQLTITKTYDDTYNWENHLFRKQKINHDQSLTYGLYSNGIYNKEKKDIELQNWGPYVSWRRPLWRNWFYLENEVSYYQDRTDENKYRLNTKIQFEMTFQ